MANVQTLAEVITRATPFAMGLGDKLYNYRGGCYRPSGIETIREAVKLLMIDAGVEDKWKSELAKEVIQYISADAPLLQDPPMDRIGCLNGIVRVDGIIPRLEPHTPELRTTVQLPVTYNPNAICPYWEQFIESTFPQDSILLPYDILAWLMIPYTKIQKAILLLGDGANGKSTFIRGLTSFLGPANISTVSLHDLEDDKFAPSQLYGKLANICPDLPNKRLATTSKFKAITGGDPVRAEYKYCDAFTFIPTARLLFSGNEMPVSADTTDGFYRRFIIVPFTKTFEENAAVAHRLDSTLSSPGELSGLFNKAIARLPQLLDKGIEITSTMSAAMKEFRDLTDPIAVWLDDEYIITKMLDDFVPRTIMYEHYKREWRKRKKVAISPESFGRAMRKLIPDEWDIRKAVNGQRLRGYGGVKERDKVAEFLG